MAGEAPEALLGLEPPTHVFVGGSSGSLKDILRIVREKNPDVRIVMNRHLAGDAPGSHGSGGSKAAGSLMRK